ncbi:MAG: phosphodiester glycosidase family protein [Rhodomicrobium sp.]
MKRPILAIAAVFIALAPAFRASKTEAASPEKPPCRSFDFERHNYTLCEAPPSRFDIRIFWRRPDGAPYTYLSALPVTDKKGGRLAFALNGGMFHPDYRPVGLYIEDGREFVRASTASGPGNFHLKPNGVFYTGEGGAGVLETGAFLKQKPKAQFATQSGPMLVIDGKLHPRIAKARSSAKTRDGVCVRDGAAFFAISEEAVPFDTFERLFRDGLKCKNALFLDGGTAPALYVPSASRGGNSFIGLGPMIAVYEKRRP